VSRVTTRGRRVIALGLPLLAAAVLTPVLAGRGAPSAPAAAAASQDELEARGRDLYREGCASCHGADGGGVVAPDGAVRGPSLEASGEASAFYYLSTGRMPLANSEERPLRKPRAYTGEQIDALVAYVATLGEGPELPEVDPEAGNLAVGGEAFRLNCQACHSAAGSGGALSYGGAAPRLGPADPQEVAAAVRVGPGQMPVFDADIIDDDALDSLVAYVEYLENPEDPGGLPIGRIGPIPEGFVAWLLGTVALLVLVAWIGTRSPVRETTET
jgi:ubiquinol-cytochrome c reductase cytochrome c subunit